MTTSKSYQLTHGVAAITLALAAVLPAHAQTAGIAGSGMRAGYGSDGYSLLPYTRSGYAGINLGKPDRLGDCVSGFSCGDPDMAVYLYTGGLINDVVGLELGYVNTGSAERHGGKTRAQGVNMSLVARVPLGAFNVFAKAGALYGQTRVSADPASGVASGTERGWGGAYAAGVGYDFTPKMGVVLEWARNEFRFAGGGRRDLDSLSLGLVHRF